MPSNPTVSRPESLQLAKDTGVPDLITGDADVFTKHDFPELLPDVAAGGRPAPPQLSTNRPVGGSRAQNLDVQHDIDLLLQAGADPGSIRVNQGQTSGGARVGTNRPDVQATLGGRRIHIEYDRAPGTRAINHARRILQNDPEAIVILKIVDF